MAVSTTFTSAEALQDYVWDNRLPLFTKAFYGFETEPHTTVFEGVKGKLPLTEMTVGTLVKRHATAFNPTAGTIDFVPRVLETVLAKVDMAFAPQDFESSYLGVARRLGQALDDLPFEAYILDKVLGKVRQEIETGVWQAAVPGSTAATDPITLLFDGYLEIIKDEITATNITPVPVSGGALSTSNIIDHLEEMWDALGDAYKMGEVDIYLSWANYKLYNRAYREAYGKYADAAQNGRTKLDFGANAYLTPLPGLSGKDRIIMTPRGNLAYGLDSAQDYTMDIVQDHREIHMMMDFRIGTQIQSIDSDLLIVNDLT